MKPALTYKTKSNQPDTEPLTLDRFYELIAELHKPQPTIKGNSIIDWNLMVKHGIGWSHEGDTVLLSSEGMRRAKACGAIQPAPIPASTPSAKPSL